MSTNTLFNVARMKIELRALERQLAEAVTAMWEEDEEEDVGGSPATARAMALETLVASKKEEIAQEEKRDDVENQGDGMRR